MQPLDDQGSNEVIIDDFSLFESLYPRLRRFAAVLADADIDPDDLVQEALAATLARHELSELEHPGAYLKQAMVRTASNQRRRASRFRAKGWRAATSDQVVDHYPSDLSVLDHLKPLDRAIVYLADIEGLPHDQIAIEVGLKPAAVRKRVSRARQQLRSALGVNVTPLSGDSQ